MDTLKFWSNELPNAPQTIEYIIRSTFARGWQLVINKDKVDPKDSNKTKIHNKVTEG